MHRPSARLLLVVAGSFAVLSAAACSDGAGSPLADKEMADLRAQLRKVEGERDKLASRVDQTERRLAGLQEDLLTVRKALATAPAADAAAAAAPAADASAAPAAAPATAPGAAKDLADILATDDGRKVFESAMRAYEARRDEERSSRMAAGMVDAFAQKANLSPEQKEKLNAIVGRTMSEMQQLFRGMRDGDVPAAERPARRQETVAKMEEIRSRTDDEVKGILDASQWDLYQQESARMRGFMGGGGGGFGGGGFGGGRGQ